MLSVNLTPLSLALAISPCHSPYRSTNPKRGRHHPTVIVDVAAPAPCDSAIVCAPKAVVPVRIALMFPWMKMVAHSNRSKAPFFVQVNPLLRSRERSAAYSSCWETQPVVGAQLAPELTDIYRFHDGGSNPRNRTTQGVTSFFIRFPSITCFAPYSVIIAVQCLSFL